MPGGEPADLRLTVHAMDRCRTRVHAWKGTHDVPLMRFVVHFALTQSFYGRGFCVKNGDNTFCVRDIGEQTLGELGFANDDEVTVYFDYSEDWQQQPLARFGRASRRPRRRQAPAPPTVAEHPTLPSQPPPGLAPEPC
eukprot:TRINITY_DN853_c0_g1_i3.p1 TRINITY_DN853_c0_g1~~TRINITY_DN853_c0_g1_i3.p1  ORF type:complete len:138 (+),score=14.71 TRINITY_DN853_c0_g1_i3:78-491(+)